ncbi:MAG: thioredoxin family protein [Halothiobacillaceae bacterium]|nr:thioredoxin family protein [Halothiobacillaceae bacterium]HER34885.1 DUF255 domain-containing protein [Halothiobacillaceae bacterium]
MIRLSAFRPRFVWLAGLLVLAIAATAPGMAKELDGFWDDPFKDLPADIDAARESGKAGVFAFFEMDDCPFCHRMKTQVFTDPEVQAYIKEHFVTVSIDIEGDTLMTAPDGEQIKEKDFAFGQYRVRATPVMIFFDTEGEPALRYTGPTQSAEEFLLLMKFVASGAYREPGMNFFKFKKQQS